MVRRRKTTNPRRSDGASSLGKNVQPPPATSSEKYCLPGSILTEDTCSEKPLETDQNKQEEGAISAPKSWRPLDLPSVSEDEAIFEVAEITEILPAIRDSEGYFFPSATKVSASCHGSPRLWLTADAMYGSSKVSVRKSVRKIAATDLLVEIIHGPTEDEDNVNAKIPPCCTQNLRRFVQNEDNFENLADVRQNEDHSENLAEVSQGVNVTKEERDGGNHLVTQTHTIFGRIDCTDDEASALVDLISQERVTLRALRRVGGSFGFTVVLLMTSLSDSPRDPSSTSQLHIHKQMAILVAWLRPEHSPEALANLPSCMEGHSGNDNRFCEDRGERDVEKERSKLWQRSGQDVTVGECSFGSKWEEGTIQMHPGGVRKFEPQELYDSIKPGKHEPELKDPLPSLLPVLRPYQRRAAFWMVQRESKDHLLRDTSKCDTDVISGVAPDPLDLMDTETHPLWMRMYSSNGKNFIYYNAYTGRFSRQPFGPSKHVKGGILADEMGLGKTVELLACILANRWKGSALAANTAKDKVKQILAKRRRERTECPCGIEDDLPDIVWVQCESCLAWQHANCVGYKPLSVTRGRRKGYGHNELTGRGSQLEMLGYSQINTQEDNEVKDCVIEASSFEGQQSTINYEQTPESRKGNIGGDGAERVSEAETQGDDNVSPIIDKFGISSLSRSEQQLNGKSEQENQGEGGQGGKGSGGERETTILKKRRKISGTAKADLCNDLNKKQKRNAGKEDERGSEEIEDGGGRFVCGKCSQIIGGQQIKGECGATLVVCPASILQQWVDEIIRHTRPGTLQVMVYHGVQKGISMLSPYSKSETIVGAYDLATADIVLTTYDTLRTDLAHDSDQGEERSLRFQKRYSVMPTPLTRLEWWRVCLDEAQLVESTTARATEMALRLPAINRWCISGTPLQRNVDDVFGLLEFLRAEPFCHRHWWTRVLQRPYEEGALGAKGKLHSFLRSLVWRNSKADVASELALPPQQMRLSRLTFSPVEAHFYKRQHHTCASTAQDIIRRHNRSRNRNFRNARALHFGESFTEGKQDVDTDTGGSTEQSRAISSAETEPTADIGSGISVAKRKDESCERIVTWESGDNQVCSGNDRDVQSPVSIASKFKEHASTVKEITSTVKKLEEKDVTDSTLSQVELAKLAGPLLRLRQACCHPQVGGLGLCSLQTGQQPMSMDDILHMLIDKARLEAEEAQRLLISALNGLAALATIEGSKKLAAECYREALRTADENSTEFRADPLQKLHILHNLALLLNSHAFSSSAEKRCNEDIQIGHHVEESTTKKRKRTGKRQRFSVSSNWGRTRLEEATGDFQISRENTSFESNYARVTVDKVKFCSGKKIALDVKDQSANARTENSGESVPAGNMLSSQYYSLCESISAATDSLQSFDNEIMASVEGKKLCFESEGEKSGCERPGEELSCERVGVKLGCEREGKKFDCEKAGEKLGCEREGERLGCEREEKLGSERKGEKLDCEKEAVAVDGRKCVESEIPIVEHRRAKKKDKTNHLGNVDLPRTLRDEKLLQQCQEIREKYMVPFHAKLATSAKDFEKIYKQVMEAQASVSSHENNNMWWLSALSLAAKGPDGGSELIKRVKNSLLETDHLATRRGGGHQNASSLALRFDTIHGLQFVLQKEIDAIEEGRNVVLTSLQTLARQVEREDFGAVEEAANCKTCDFNMEGPSCRHCQLQEQFELYEGHLFLLRTTAAGRGGLVSASDAILAQQNQTRLKAIHNASGAIFSANDQSSSSLQVRRKSSNDAAIVQVTWAPSETERVLRLLSNSLRQMDGTSAHLSSSAKRHLEKLEAMRREFGVARALAEVQRQVLRALDELHMATTRIQLRLVGEEVTNKVEQLVKVLPVEVPQMNARLTGDKFAALDTLKKAQSQLRYLKGLAAVREKGSERATEEEFCPVCHEGLGGGEKAVLHCGHVLCVRCFLRMAEVSRDRQIACPSCRSRQILAEVAISRAKNMNRGNRIERLSDEEAMESTIEVKGSYGTKIEAVIRRIKWIVQEDPKAKILVFSSWEDVLSLVEHALQSNNIMYARAKGSRGLSQAIRTFKGINNDKDKFCNCEKRRQRSTNLDLSSCEVHSNLANRESMKTGGTTVLLLPVKQGANGLNLVEAQHVMLVEPLLNSAAEAQAVNRVHRIGQNLPTFVHRFVIHDTVEVAIYNMGLHGKVSGKGGKGRGSETTVGGTHADVKNLTVADVGTLFDWKDTVELNDTKELNNTEENVTIAENSHKLPPSMAAAIAAERRAAFGHKILSG